MNKTHTSHVRMITYQLPEGSMSYENVTKYYVETLAERDRLKAQVEELRGALEAVCPMFDNDSPLLTVYAAEIAQARAALAKVSQ